jgi:serine/threonine protein phosphatase PrpC
LEKNDAGPAQPWLEEIGPAPAEPPVPALPAPAESGARCPACGASSNDPQWCDRCGAQLQAAPPPSQPTPLPFDPGAEVRIGERTYTLAERLPPRGAAERWSARGDDGAPAEVHATFAREATALVPTLAPAVWLPLAETRDGARLLRAYAPPSGDALADLLRERQPLPVVFQAVAAVADALEALHAHGRLALGLHPDLVRFSEGRARLYWDGPFPALGETPSALAPVPGFSAPEAFGRGEGRLSPATDVFPLGMLLYYLAAHAPLIPEVAESGVELPPVRAWSPGAPFGIEGVIRRATHRLASRRTPTVAAFRTELLEARRRIERRATFPYDAARATVALETHVGLAKGKARPVNEDAAFAAVGPSGAHALLAVADGVSHATLGTGDIASRILVEAARERWQRLAGGRLLASEIAPRVAENLLASIVRGANHEIVAQACALATGPARHEDEVMATTAVLALVDGNRLHLANLGDSRAYLFSEGELEVLSADHDVRGEMLRAGRRLADARAAAGGSQLTRFVGRLEVQDGVFLPVDPEPDFLHLSLAPGDRLLLCSDGLSDYVGATEVESALAIAAVLREHRDPARAAFELVVAANRAGGGDNITCVLLDVASAVPA